MAETTREPAVELAQPLPKGTKDQATEGFVKDGFFERGYLWLKVREIVVTLLIAAFLIVPILVLINSASRAVVWDWLYHWEYADGHALVRFLITAIAIIVVVVLAFSIYLLARNNHRERKVLPNRKTYDVEGMERRKAILNQMYDERFGPQEVRHGSRYYVVAPEQNLPTTYLHDLFREAGTDVGGAEVSTHDR